MKKTSAHTFLKTLPLFAVLVLLISSCTPKLTKPTYRAPNRIAEFDSLMVNLQANNYDFDEGASLPDLYWDDIPHLLKIAESDLTLTYFPRNGASSYAQHQAYMGIVAMWMIESIRLDDPNREFDEPMQFPSMNPILGSMTLDGTPDLSPDTFIELRRAAEAYERWWSSYKYVGIDALRKTDPLAGTGLKWN